MIKLHEIAGSGKSFHEEVENFINNNKIDNIYYTQGNVTHCFIHYVEEKPKKKAKKKVVKKNG